MTAIASEDILWEILKLTRQLSADQKMKLSELLLIETQPSAEEANSPSKMGSLTEYAGVGAELWQQIDVGKYIAEERASWEVSSPK